MGTSRIALARVRVAAPARRASRAPQPSVSLVLPQGPAMESKQRGTFNAQVFLNSAGVAKTIVEYRRGGVIFTQGDPCESFLYIQKGRVKISALSKTGREVIVAILGAGDFFGEGGLAGQPVRMGSATAITRSTILFVDQNAMARLLHREHALSDWFIARMLVRNIRIEADLVDQFFNSSEKRLARTLLLLSQTGREDMPLAPLPKISQATLADLVGTTRSRVSFFMNRFRKLGFIEYSGLNRIHVNSSLLSVVPLQ